MRSLVLLLMFVCGCDGYVLLDNMGKARLPQTQPIPAKHNAILLLIVKSDKEIVSYTKDVYLPFTPAPGQQIDLLFQVKLWSYDTVKNRFMVTLDILEVPKGKDAREYFKIMTPLDGNTWKELHSSKGVKP
jgi:hypothetical protein